MQGTDDLSAQYGLKTVKAIIRRWVPSVENNAAAYVQSVESKIPGHKLGAEVDLGQMATIKAFAVAIIVHENANYAYPTEVLAEGVRRALLLTDEGYDFRIVFEGDEI